MNAPVLIELPILPGHCEMGTGWSVPEQDRIWTVGERSDLVFRLEADLGPERQWLLRFTAFPSTAPQRMRIVFDGDLLLEAKLTTQETFACRLPNRGHDKGQRVRITIEHPDYQRLPPPSRDPRLLSVGFRSISIVGLDEDNVPGDRDLALRFESIGDNCEFGIVQRALGAEPVGLMRFASLPRHRLVTGLETRFEAFADPASLYFTFNAEREFIIRDRKTEYVGHTGIFEGSVDSKTLLEQQVRRLAFMRRVTLEAMDSAEQIFVYKENETPDEASILPIWMALRRYAPNTLLWAVTATHQCQVGTVEMILPGLMRGYVDRFSPYTEIRDFSVPAWRMMLREAWRLWARTTGRL